MKFKVKNGTDHISIGLSDIGSYFRFDNPLSVVWYDNHGSIGKYFCLLPYSPAYRNELRGKLMSNLNVDFSTDLERLYELLRPLFSLFKNGEYDLSFYRNEDNKSPFKYKTSNDNYAEWHHNPLETAIINSTNEKTVNEIKAEHKTFLAENEISKKYYASNLLDYSTYNLYDASECFFATEPLSIINQDRVDYFEQQINAGERPFVIIMQACYPEKDLDSSYFIVDGHHKLLAYQKLNLYPAMALISYLPTTINEIEFDAEKLTTVLYPWQMDHILEHWQEKDDYINEKLKDPDSPLHQVVKNGNIAEYYENGNLKHEAFYINGKIDGKSLDWYEDGQLKYERHYNKGKRTGTWRDYYQSGQLQYIQPFGDEGGYEGHLISYYESGQKRWMQSISNGRNVDGYSYNCWFANGDKEAELKYLNGNIVERKNWNSWGQLVNHEIFDEETKRLVKQQVENKYPINKIIHTPLQNNKTPNLNIIRERQYPETNYKGIWRLVILAILMLIQLLRMCR